MSCGSFSDSSEEQSPREGEELENNNTKKQFEIKHFSANSINFTVSTVEESGTDCSSISFGNASKNTFESIEAYQVSDDIVYDIPMLK